MFVVLLPLVGRAQQATVSIGQLGGGTSCSSPSGSNPVSCSINTSAQNSLPTTITVTNGADTEGGGANPSVTGTISGNTQVNTYIYDCCMIQFAGHGANVDPTLSFASFWQGPAFTVSNSATLNWNPSSTIGAALSVFSEGAAGLNTGNHNVAGYNAVTGGGNGGMINVTHSGSINLYAPNTGSSDPNPVDAAIRAYSLGGPGGAYNSNNDCCAGIGGAGNSVSVSTTAGSSITLNGIGPYLSAGIQATSQGGLPAHEQAAGNNDIGVGGAGGFVSVTHAGTIASDSSNSAGIVAVSVGGSGTAPDGAVSIAGPGGTTQVTLQPTAQINMTGGNSVGVMAASSAGADSVAFLVGDNAGGAVRVDTEAGSSINVGSDQAASNQLSIGILAVSSGSASILEPFNSRSTVNTGGAGDSGAVTVNNAGTVRVSGQMGIGIAAISVGGAGIVTNTSASTAGFLGNSATNSLPTQSAAVNVSNTGSIATDGSSAFGIVALSSGGGGGILNQDSSVANIVVGANTAAGGSSQPGGPVTIDNSGTVTTGDSQGGGKAAIGLLAQSIGGGGGSNSGVSLFVGDAGGGGGNGGVVTVTNSGTLSTQNDGAIGILAQSIGGGGGNGGNAAGVFVATGGAGGGGGSADTVLGQNSGTVTTNGDFAAGAIAQSVGGGGGNGGYGKSIGPFISVALGGTAGGGGNGGEVLFNNQSTLQTSGQNSLGVLAQSIGGGGGNGGSATGKSLDFVFGTSIAIGGSGGAGGAGGAVAVTNEGQIATSGPDSIGIIAQSIGGGGGAGGAATAKTIAVSVPEIPTFTFAASVGGSGKAGGDGGSVLLRNAGQITTDGDGAHGILAQSIGGGGGNGGDSTAATHAIAVGAPVVALSIALGATGGGAGSGGPVAVFDSAASLGALANFSVSEVWPPPNLPPDVTLPALSGGNIPTPDIGAIPSGWSAPACGNCPIRISTGGQNAPGIAAQSIGGGGGNSTAGSASNDSPNLGDAGGDTYGFNMSLGASGGSGGAGSTVIVTTDSATTLTTTGSGSPGILAQSIGGGGGSSSGSSFGLSVSSYSPTISAGGTGVTGSDAGAVIVSNAGAITTAGGDGIGIVGQSIGGGGGLAGSSDASATVSASNQAENEANVPKDDSYDANVAIGGKGGGGGNGGGVAIYNAGAIGSAGERAYGIEAQSVGGGGGNGGTATSTAQGSTNTTFSASVDVGGSGGAGGAGGDVGVVSRGSIVTRGYNALGIVAQSIGGGGGIGGDGSYSSDTTIGLGVKTDGSSGGSGTGGPVDVVTLPGGAVTTFGDDASAVLVQSIGGGGGTGAAGCNNSTRSVAAGATSCYPGGASATVAAQYASPRYTLNVGAATGASGNGNTVLVDLADAIVTHGDRSMGVVAQSIGGGGGYLTAPAQNIANTGVAENPGISNGTGGPVTVNVEAGASITTSGAGAWGILAQSVGGGGGLAGDPSLAMVFPVSNTLQPGLLTGNAYATTVSVNLAGDVTTTGANAHGVFAQSLGGSGGIAAGCCLNPGAQLLAGNNAQFRGTSNKTYWGGGGAISITQSPGTTIETSGNGSIGIVAQSTGVASDVRTINVTIGGAVIGGTNGGVAVPGGMAGAAGILLSGGGLDAGNPNTITINAGGSVGTVDGVAGTAITTNDGMTNVVNSGTITGSVNLGSTPGSITNYGTMNTGSTIVVSDDPFTNAGIVDVGGPGAIGTTIVTGGYTQVSGGQLRVDVNSLAPQSADRLDVSGDASIAGTIVPTATALLPGTLTILTAGNLTSSATTQDPLTFRWNPRASDNVLSLSPVSNFRPATVSLTDSQGGVADYLTRAWANGDRFFAARFGYLSQVANAAAYTGFLTAISGKGLEAQPTALASSAGAVLGAPLSCPVFVSDGTLLGEDSCVWAKFIGESTSQYAGDGEPGYHVDGTSYRLGAQKQIAPDWYLGGSLGTGINWLSAGTVTGSGQIFDGSVAIKHTIGPWLFAGSVALANGSFQNERTIFLPAAGTAPGTNAVLRSDSSTFLAGGRLRGAYEFALARTYVRLIGDLDVVYTDTPGFEEAGAGELALSVRGGSHTSVAVSPTVEFGGRYDLSSGTTLRPYLDLGVSFLPDNARALTASVAGASAADGTFTTVGTSPDVLGRLSLGMQLYKSGRYDARAEYGIRVGEAYFGQGGTLSVGYHF